MCRLEAMDRKTGRGWAHAHPGSEWTLYYLWGNR